MQSPKVNQVVMEAINMIHSRNNQELIKGSSYNYKQKKKEAPFRKLSPDAVKIKPKGGIIKEIKAKRKLNKENKPIKISKRTCKTSRSFLRNSKLSLSMIKARSKNQLSQKKFDHYLNPKSCLRN